MSIFKYMVACGVQACGNMDIAYDDVKQEFTCGEGHIFASIEDVQAGKPKRPNLDILAPPPDEPPPAEAPIPVEPTPQPENPERVELPVAAKAAPKPMRMMADSPFGAAAIAEILKLRNFLALITKQEYGPNESPVDRAIAFLRAGQDIGGIKHLPSGDLQVALKIEERHVSGIMCEAEQQMQPIQQYLQEQFDAHLDNGYYYATPLPTAAAK